MMNIPEDTDDHEPCFGLPSHQNCKEEEFDLKKGFNTVKKDQLSVIFSEHESQAVSSDENSSIRELDESNEHASDGFLTLSQSKSLSRSRRKKKQNKKDIKAKEKLE